MRIIQPSLAGQLARLLASLGSGLALLLGVFIPTGLLALQNGVPLTVWFAATALVLIVVALPLGVLARKLGGWRPAGPGIPLMVLSLSPGILRHEIEVEGRGTKVWLRTVALRSTLFAALREADQLPVGLNLRRDRA